MKGGKKKNMKKVANFSNLLYTITISQDLHY